MIERKAPEWYTDFTIQEPHYMEAIMGKDLHGKEIGKGIRQIKDGRFEARYIDRFGRRKSLYGKTKIEIKNKLSQALKENTEAINVRKRWKLKQWYQVWLDSYKRPVVRKNTIRHYKMIFDKHILPEIGEMYLSEVRQIHIQNLINKLDRDGYQWETQNKVRILILDLFNIAIDNEYAIKNPAKGIRINKTKSEERTVLTVDQQKDFFTCAAGTFYYNLFVVMINTGLRPGEACAIQEDDIDFDNHVLTVDSDQGTLIYQELEGDHGKQFHLGPPKTKSSVRDIPMTEACEKALKDQIRLKTVLDRRLPRHDEFNGLLFRTQRNNPVCDQVLNESIKRIVDEINLQRDPTDLFPDFTAHAFRHTFATRALEAGMQLKTVQKLLGHANLQMTSDLYVHITSDFKQEEMQKLKDIFPETT